RAGAIRSRQPAPDSATRQQSSWRVFYQERLKQVSASKSSLGGSVRPALLSDSLGAASLGGSLGAASAGYAHTAYRPESRGQAVAHLETDIQIRAVDNGQTKAAGRHRMGFEWFVVPERDLNAGNLGILIDQPVDPGAVDFVARAMLGKQDDTVTGAPIRILKTPDSVAVERDDGFDPALAINIRPLIGEPEVAFDDFAADGLEINNSGVAIEFPAEPSAAIRLDLCPRLAMNRPIVERAGLEALPGSMAPPPSFAINHSDISTQVLAA